MPDSRTLRPDVHLPYLGFGTYLIRDGEARAAVGAAIRAGYRHIDTAEVYNNETGVGLGLADGLATENLARTDVFVTTKLFLATPPGDSQQRDLASLVC